MLDRDIDVQASYDKKKVLALIQSISLWMYTVKNLSKSYMGRVKRIWYL